jgi:hypothetical protein
LDLLNSTIIAVDLKTLITFAYANEGVVLSLMKDRNVILFSIKESKKRVRFGYIPVDKRVAKFFDARHKYEEKIIHELGIAIVCMMPVQWKNLNATKVADFMIDCVVNLFERAQQHK